MPQLYRLPIDELTKIIAGCKPSDDAKANLAVENIQARLRYLQDVGLGYLSLEMKILSNPVFQ